MNDSNGAKFQKRFDRDFRELKKVHGSEARTMVGMKHCELNPNAFDDLIKDRGSNLTPDEIRRTRELSKACKDVRAMLEEDADAYNAVWQDRVQQQAARNVAEKEAYINK